MCLEVGSREAMMLREIQTCVVAICGRDELEGGRRFYSGTNALQQGEQRVPVVRTVDVGCIGLQKLMKAISHFPTDSGQDVRFHHQQETQREEDLWRRGDQGWTFNTFTHTAGALTRRDDS